MSTEDHIAEARDALGLTYVDLANSPEERELVLGLASVLADGAPITARAVLDLATPTEPPERTEMSLLEVAKLRRGEHIARFRRDYT